MNRINTPCTPPPLDGRQQHLAGTNGNIHTGDKKARVQASRLNTPGEAKKSRCPHCTRPLGASGSCPRCCKDNIAAEIAIRQDSHISLSGPSPTPGPSATVPTAAQSTVCAVLGKYKRSGFSPCCSDCTRPLNEYDTCPAHGGDWVGSEGPQQLLLSLPPSAAGEKLPPTGHAASTAVAPVDDFEAMGLSPLLLQGIYGCGYGRPSIVQQQAIVPAANGRDMVIQAQSGTGKTATFALAALQQVDTRLRQTQVLILSPSRELSLATRGVVASLGRYMKATAMALVGGGARMRVEETRALRQGTHVVSGTIGSVLLMLRAGRLSPRSIRVVVLDEADDLLSERSMADVKTIFQALPHDVQALLVSATMSSDALKVARQILRNPVLVLLDNADVSLQGIRQYYFQCGRNRGDKTGALLDLYQQGLANRQTMVFVNTTDQARRLAEDMKVCAHGNVRAFHGGLDQSERRANLQAFCDGSASILVCTDVLARGIDVQQVSAVVNYDLPRAPESYIHRIGRGGRFGRSSFAINLVSERDLPGLEVLERHWSCQCRPLPKDFGSLI